MQTAMGPHRVYPDLLAHLSTDVAHALDVVNTQGLQAAISQHAQHLGILCSANKKYSIPQTRLSSRPLKIIHYSPGSILF
jgi:hypothetical protein